MKKQNGNNNRGDKVASTIRRQIAEILQNDYSDDPVLSRVSIVDVASGLQFIKLFYYVRTHPAKSAISPGPGGGADADVQKRLDAETPKIRHELAARIHQKYVPNIRFVYDDTLEKSERIDELLANIKL